jgi:lysophospholipase
MRKWLRSLVFILGIFSEPLQATGREANFLEWATRELTPWFQSQPDQFITSRVPSPKPVVLRYKTFLQDKARGHIVIVHGYGERIEKHMEMIFDFYQAGFNVFALDQRGFGRSTRLNPEGKDSIYVESFDYYTQDLEQFFMEVVKPHGPQPAFIFAHSMGGLVGTLFVHKRPDLVRAAILSAPMHTIKLTGITHRMTLLLAQTAVNLGFGASYAFGQIGPRKAEFSAKSGTSSQARYQFYADFYNSPEEWPLSLGGSSFQWLEEALQAGFQVVNEEWARQINTPILLFQADQDTYVSPDGQNEFCSYAQRCQKIFVPGTRHEIFREQDAARAFYMNSIFKFLDEQTRPGPNPATQP